MRGAESSLGIGELLQTHQYDVGDIRLEALKHEQRGMDLYRRLPERVDGKSDALEEMPAA